MSDLRGRSILITGARGALGDGLVRAFAGAGAEVLAVSRSTGNVQVPGVRYESADLAEESSAAALFARVPTPWAVINTVGGFAPRRTLAELDVAELEAQLHLNLPSAAIVTKYTLQSFAKEGQGRLIHTASRAATAPAGAGFAYSVSKVGVVHLVQMAARDVAGTQIRVNAVSPAIIDTPANRAAMPGADHDRWPTPTDSAARRPGCGRRPGRPRRRSPPRRKDSCRRRDRYAPRP